MGAGTSGCMATIKLLGAGHDVVLVERGTFSAWDRPAEAGGTAEGSYCLHSTPISWGDAAYSSSSSRSVQHTTVPQPQLAGRTVAYPQGRGAGGTLNVNAMIWSAGHRAVFDNDWPEAWSSATIDRYITPLCHPLGESYQHVPDELCSDCWTRSERFASRTPSALAGMWTISCLL